MTEDEIYQKLVNEAKSKINGFIEFDGMNCHDLDDDWNNGISCAGWDGEERRCMCGNRRVSWVLSDCKTYVYPEAY